jgi:hypothetical protein
MRIVAIDVGRREVLDGYLYSTPNFILGVEVYLLLFLFITTQRWVVFSYTFQTAQGAIRSLPRTFHRILLCIMASLGDANRDIGDVLLLVHLA